MRCNQTADKMLKVYALCFCYFVSHCAAFGATGHYVIGEAVSSLVANTTRDWVETKGFFAEYNNSWGVSSLQADFLKRRPALRWTTRYHYLDTNDDPPTFCPGVKNWSTMKSGNILKGIDRFTSLLLTEKGNSFSALMLVHLLQDSALPTHLTGHRGGNDVTVKYNGQYVNLHRLFDSVLVQELADRAGGRDALIDEIVEGAKPRFCATMTSHSSWMDSVVEKADSIQRLNCKIVWRDELRTPDILLPFMHGLLVDAAAFSACHWDRLAATHAALRIQG
jgi:hypothetical protein